MYDYEKVQALAARVPLPPNTPVAAIRGSVGEIYIYQDIGPDSMGGLSSKAFQAQLQKLSGVQDLNIFINSAGGSTMEALAIYNDISTFPAKNKVVTVTSVAASAASVIAMAGTKIVMAPEAEMMIHNPHIVAGGNAKELRDMADMLDRIGGHLLSIYSKRTGLSAAQLQPMLDAETYMNAEEAVRLGFADEILGQAKAKRRVAAFDPNLSQIGAAFVETKRRLIEAQVAAARVSADSMRRKTSK